MLFNSYIFLLAFLPVACLVFHVLRRCELHRAAILSLTLFSLLFYGWWKPSYLLLLLAVILVNYVLSRIMASARTRKPLRTRRLILAFGVGSNLALLGWFKYATFIAGEASALLGTTLDLPTIILPLGISFYVFQMIGALVDSHQGKVERFKSLVDFTLFVAFFPQLIAGPIVHHSEVMPQFQKRVAILPLVPMGLTILCIGLGKKVLLADSIAPYASARFDAAALGQALSVADAWAGALAYTAQLYFDFSGYSDMAIGAGLLFGIRIPVNFASPYAATSIIEFWRRWHMTLSRFLRDYLYIPLGGNRLGPTRRQVNLFLTMVLGGIWHGAGWTFLVWGVLHGVYLAANHSWRHLWGRLGVDPGGTLVGRAVAWAITFAAVIAAWVFFRAANVPTAVGILTSMFDLQAAGTPAVFADTREAALVAFGLLVVASVGPNTQELTGYSGAHADDRPPAWRARPVWAVAAGTVFALALMSLTRVSEFIYFQF